MSPLQAYKAKPSCRRTNLCDRRHTGLPADSTSQPNARQLQVGRWCFATRAPVGAIGLFPNTAALVRDGSRTRDRQIRSLMLYPLSYSGRCYAEPASFHRGSRGTRNPNVGTTRKPRRRNSHRPIAQR